MRCSICLVVGLGALFSVSACDSNDVPSRLDFVGVRQDSISREPVLISVSRTGTIRVLRGQPAGKSFGPRCSRDGTKVVFESTNSGSFYQNALWVLEDERSRLLKDERGDALLATAGDWSQDDRFVVSSRPDDCLAALGCGGGDILVTDVRSGATKVLTTGANADLHPVYANNGRIVYWSMMNDGTSGYFSMNADGTGIRRVVETDGIIVSSIVRGPTDYEVTAVEQDRSDVGALGPKRTVVLNAETGGKSLLRPPGVFGDSEIVFSGGESWNAAGSRFLFTTRIGAFPTGRWYFRIGDTERVTSAEFLSGADEPDTRVISRRPSGIVWCAAE